MNYGDAIQNKLVSLATAFSFATITYRPSPTGQQRCTEATKCAKPAAAVAWPESAVFGDPPRHHRASDRREVIGWIWKLQVQFNQNVSLEEFEKSLLDNIPRIPRDPTKGLDRQVDLLLEEAEYQNPVTQQQAQGTRVTYRFTAQLTPT